MRCNPWRWLWGLIPVAILTFLTVQWEHERIETDLRQRSETALRSAGLPWAVTAFDGRDGLIKGQATTDDAPQRALGVVRNVWGVRISDQQTRLLPRIDPYVWQASHRGQRLRLAGYAPSEEARTTILGMAKSVFPGRGIDDGLELARGAPEERVWLGGIDFGMKQLAGLREGAVSLENTGFTIEGVAETLPAYKSIKGAVRNALPDGVRLVAEKVTAPVVRPFTWAARRKGNQIQLEGYVTEEALREQIFAHAKKTFPRHAIVDRMEWGSGAPAGLAALARAALEQLALLDAGEVVMTDAKARISGAAPDEATAKKAAAALRNGAKGFEVSDAITFPEPKPAPVSPYVISVDGKAGGLIVSGHVPSEDARTKLIAAIREQFPGRDVRDGLAIASGEPAGWLGCVQAGLAALKSLDSATFTMTDQKLALSGRTRDEAVADKLAAELRTAANRSCETSAEIAYDAPPEPELVWRASHDGAGTVLIEGEVIDARTRAALVQAATRFFPNAQIQDRMTIIGGASTKWPVAAELGLKLMAMLRKGEAHLTRNVLLVRGEAKDTAVQTTLREQLSRMTPKGYRGQDLVEVRSDAMIWAEQEARRKAEEEANRKTQDEARRKADEEARRRAEEETRRKAAEEEARRKAEADARRKAAEDEARRKAEEEARRKAAEEETRRKAETTKRKQEADTCQVRLREVATSGIIRFDWASANLDRASRPTLERLAETARACPTARIEIEGHTDAEGTPERNKNLSERRAQAVYDYLAKAGIGADRLSAVGYGETRPIAPNDTPANRAKNRRIEFTVSAE